MNQVPERIKKRIDANNLLIKELIVNRALLHFAETNWLHYKDFLEMIENSIKDAKKLK